MKPILKIENIWKAYKIGGQQQRYLSLRDRMSQVFQKRAKSEEFWALRDVSFEVQEGECLGIIGRNGAGKSTLLKILSRITPPTKGRIVARGRVASLLEVGTGFHPELTGRENIYLNGSILGLRRAEINRKFDEIVDFSGVEQFLDTPLKHYSSGMQLRLAFSVAAHLEPEILLIDEVLAVGDIEFQKKCLGKMDEVSKSGRTVLFVSHNMGAVRQLCSRGILLEGGEGGETGLIEEVIKNYMSLSTQTLKTPQFKGPLNAKVEFESIKLNGSNLLSGETLTSQLDELNFEIRLKIKQLKPFRITLSIYREGTRICSFHDEKPTASPNGLIASHYCVPAKILRPGLYSVSIGGLEVSETGDWFHTWDVCFFSVTEEWSEDIDPLNHGLVNIPAKTYRENL